MNNSKQQEEEDEAHKAYRLGLEAPISASNPYKTHRVAGLAKLWLAGYAKTHNDSQERDQDYAD